MAKRYRSQADDSATTTPGQPRARRARGTPAPGDLDPQALGPVGTERPVELNHEMTARSEHAERSSVASPTEDDIRVRAYHRYLERGGVHGMAFDDWLEAERELKLRG